MFATTGFWPVGSWGYKVSSTLGRKNLKRNNHRPFWICVWEKLGLGNHVIIVTSCFLSTRNTGVYKFLGLTIELKLRLQIPAAYCWRDLSLGSVVIFFRNFIEFSPSGFCASFCSCEQQSECTIWCAKVAVMLKCGWKSYRTWMCKNAPRNFYQSCKYFHTRSLKWSIFSHRLTAKIQMNDSGRNVEENMDW